MNSPTVSGGFIGPRVHLSSLALADLSLQSPNWHELRLPTTPYETCRCRSALAGGAGLTGIVTVPKSLLLVRPQIHAVL